MKRKSIERYYDIKIAIDNILCLIGDLDYAVFKHKMSTSTQYKFMVSMNYIIVGEAIKSILISLKKNDQQINWKRFIYIRNDIIHHYYRTAQNTEKIWDCYKSIEMEKLHSFITRISHS